MRDQREQPGRTPPTRAALRAGLGMLLGAGAMMMVGWTSIGAPRAGDPAESQAPDGKRLYTISCGACHGAEGAGAGEFPPLAGSGWVTGDEGRLIRIVLHGLEGPVEVKGETYEGMMPGWGQAMQDADLAAVLTYIRASFGNKAPAVTPAVVARVRRESGARNKPWTVEELVRSTASTK